MTQLTPVSALSSSEQLQMQRVIEQKQLKDFMRLYSGLVERCFGSCIHDFTSRAITSKESECVAHGPAASINQNGSFEYPIDPNPCMPSARLERCGRCVKCR